MSKCYNIWFSLIIKNTIERYIKSIKYADYDNNDYDSSICHTMGIKTIVSIKFLL